MTKKDYELFAYNLNVSKDKWCSGEFEEVVDFIASIFKQENTSFKIDKFKEACYSGKHIRKAIKGGV